MVKEGDLEYQQWRKNNRKGKDIGSYNIYYHFCLEFLIVCFGSRSKNHNIVRCS